MKRNHIVPLAVLLFASASPASSDHAISAPSYPDKPVRVIVPSLSGSTADLVARVIAPRLSARLGHRFIIDNRAGGNGLMATELAAKATPNGYTLLVGTTGTLTVMRHLQKNVPYDVLKDFTPIGLLSMRPYLLATHPALPVRSVSELVSLAQKTSGRLAYSSAGKGSSTHLAMELFSSMAGIELRHVPYKSSPQATQSVVAGRVPVAMVSMQNGVAPMQAGRLLVLAITSKARWPQAPQVPTVAESGLPGFEALTWFALVAPARTPSHVVTRLSESLQGLIGSAEVSAEFARAGLGTGNPDRTLIASLIKHDIEFYGKLTRMSGVKVN
jgi:tripartite-type tricarboxylate transporter receptor subunit TctC